MFASKKRTLFSKCTLEICSLRVSAPSAVDLQNKVLFFTKKHGFNFKFYIQIYMSFHNKISISDPFEDINFLCLCTPNTGTLSGLGWWRVVRFLISLSQMIGNGCDQVLDHADLNNLNVGALGPPLLYISSRGSWEYRYRPGTAVPPMSGMGLSTV